MSALELRGELIQNNSVFEMDLFIIDHAASEYLMEGVEGVAELLYADGTVCSSIAFNEYFGLDTGQFKLSFWNVQDYPKQGVRVRLLQPQVLEHLVTLADSLVAQTHTSESYINTFAKPLDI